MSSSADLRQQQRQHRLRQRKLDALRFRIGVTHGQDNPYSNRILRILQSDSKLLEHLLNKSTEGGIAYLEQAVAAADAEKSAGNGDSRIRFKETLSPANAESGRPAPSSRDDARDGLHPPKPGESMGHNGDAANTRQQQKGASQWDYVARVQQQAAEREAASAARQKQQVKQRVRRDLLQQMAEREDRRRAESMETANELSKLQQQQRTWQEQAQKQLIEDAQQKEKNHKLMSEHIESRSLAHKKAVAQRVKQERRILKQERRLQRELQQTETTKCMEKREMFEQIRRCNEEAEQQKAQRLKQEREEDLRTLEEYERQLVERDRQRELQAQARCRTDWRVHEPDLNEKMSASGHDDRILLEQMQKEMREWERKEKEKAIKRVEERNARNLILQRQVQEKAHVRDLEKTEEQRIHTQLQQDAFEEQRRQQRQKEERKRMQQQYRGELDRQIETSKRENAGGGVMSAVEREMNTNYLKAFESGKTDGMRLPLPIERPIVAEPRRRRAQIVQSSSDEDSDSDLDDAEECRRRTASVIRPPRPEQQAQPTPRAPEDQPQTVLIARRRSHPTPTSSRSLTVRKGTHVPRRSNSIIGGTNQHLPYKVNDVTSFLNISKQDSVDFHRQMREAYECDRASHRASNMMRDKLSFVQMPYARDDDSGPQAALELQSLYSQQFRPGRPFRQMAREVLR